MSAAAAVAAKDTQLLDWAETEVISISAHPLGWEVLYAGADGEPAVEDAKLFEVETIREALATAWEEQKALFAAQAGAAGEVPVPDVPDAQLRFVGGAIVEDAGGD